MTLSTSQHYWLGKTRRSHWNSNCHCCLVVIKTLNINKWVFRSTPHSSLWGQISTPLSRISPSRIFNNKRYSRCRKLRTPRSFSLASCLWTDPLRTGTLGAPARVLRNSLMLSKKLFIVMSKNVPEPNRYSLSSCLIPKDWGHRTA